MGVLLLVCLQHSTKSKLFVCKNRLFRNKFIITLQQAPTRGNPYAFFSTTKKARQVISNCLTFYLSGYQDSNLGPPAPKAGALTGLRYTPLRYAGRGKDPPVSPFAVQR